MLVCVSSLCLALVETRVITLTRDAQVFDFLNLTPHTVYVATFTVGTGPTPNTPPSLTDAGDIIRFRTFGDTAANIKYEFAVVSCNRWVEDGDSVFLNALAGA